METAESQENGEIVLNIMAALSRGFESLSAVAVTSVVIMIVYIQRIRLTVLIR